MSNDTVSTKELLKHPAVAKTVVGSGASIMFAMIWSITQGLADIKSDLKTQEQILRSSITELDSRLDTFSSIYNERILGLDTTLHSIDSSIKSIYRDLQDTNRRVDRLENFHLSIRGEHNELR